MCLLTFALLLAFASTFRIIHTQDDPPGYISLDCGLRESNGYNYPEAGSLYYSKDDNYIETGQGESISPEFQTKAVPQQYYSVRTFPGSSQGMRNCYTFMPFYGKGKKILMRVSFMYGNYDDLNKPPQFDMYLGVDYWETVSTDSTTIFVREILHVPTSDYLHLCLVDMGKGTPFISVIELRPVDPVINPTYNTTNSASLQLLQRWDLGASTASFVRYKDDEIDRMWKPGTVDNSTSISNPNAVTFTGNSLFNAPPIVMRTASQALNVNDSLVFSFSPASATDEVYFYLYFAELLPNQPNTIRQIDIYLNGLHWSHGPINLQYLVVTPVYTIGPGSYSTYTVKLVATSNSTLPVMINAFEVYTVKLFLHHETDENEVAAMNRIKSAYAISDGNWQGDPCLPRQFAWFGINCSYNAFDPPNIVSLNLSSRGLNGDIVPSMSNITMLQSLDLSHNNLSGQVPDFLARLPSLKYLNLKGNNFSGPLSPELLKKAQNGSLVLSFDVPSNYSSNPACSTNNNNSCKNKNKSPVIVPVVASSAAAAFVVIIILSTFLYFAVIRKRRQVSQQVNANEPKARGVSSYVHNKVKKLKYSMVENLIRDKSIIGQGAFGVVYKSLMDGTEVAVKLPKDSPNFRTKDFESEVKILANVHHGNLVSILGYCNERAHKAIIFEFVGNGSLHDHLSARNPNVLNWERRLSILNGAAEGLKYLHHHCRPPIIHRDIKSSNILLTDEFEAKLADFGLSRIMKNETSKVAGTLGYMPPEHQEGNLLTESDVYSFGVVILEVVCGKPAVSARGVSLIRWVQPRIQSRDIQSIVDPRLDQNFNVEVAWKVVRLAMVCVSDASRDRPDMNRVVQILKECLPESGNNAGEVEMVPYRRGVFAPHTT